MNKITFSGRVVADAEVRFTPGGQPICSFRVASDVGFGDKKTTNWFQCQVWGNRGESLSPMLTKATPVTIFGTLTLREWQDKDGLKRISPDVRVDEVALHGKRDDSGAQTASHAPQQRQQSAQTPQQRQQPPHPADLDDDMPPF